MPLTRPASIDRATTISGMRRSPMPALGLWRGLIGTLVAACALTAAYSSGNTPQLVRNHNNGSDEYKLVVKAANTEAISLGVEEARKFCRSLNRKAEILGSTYAPQQTSSTREIFFYCWDLDLAAKLYEQKQRPTPPGN